MIGTRVERPRPDSEKVPESSIVLSWPSAGMATPWAMRSPLNWRSMARRSALPSTFEDERHALQPQVAERHLDIVFVSHSGVVTTTWSAWSTAKVAIGAVTPVPRSRRMTS